MSDEFAPSNRSVKRKRNEICSEQGPLSSLTQYKGVEFNSRSGKWVVKFIVDGLPKTLPGKYDTDKEAAEAYDAYQRSRGRTCGFNFPKSLGKKASQNQQVDKQPKKQTDKQPNNKPKIPKILIKKTHLGAENGKQPHSQSSVFVSSESKSEPEDSPGFISQNINSAQSQAPNLNLAQNIEYHKKNQSQQQNYKKTSAQNQSNQIQESTQNTTLNLNSGVSLVAKRTQSQEAVSFGRGIDIHLNNDKTSLLICARKCLKYLSQSVENIIDEERHFMYCNFGPLYQDQSELDQWKNVKLWFWLFADGQDPMLCRQCGRAITCFFGTCSRCKSYTFYCRMCTLEMMESQGKCLACEYQFGVNTLLLVYRILDDSQIDQLLLTDWKRYQQVVTYDISREQLYRYLLSQLPEECLCISQELQTDKNKPMFIARIDAGILDSDLNIAQIAKQIWDVGFPLIISNCINRQTGCQEWKVNRIKDLIQRVDKNYWVDYVGQKEKFMQKVPSDKFFQNYQHQLKGSERCFMKLDNVPQGHNLLNVDKQSVSEVLDYLPKSFQNILHPYDGAENLATYGQPLVWNIQQQQLQHMMGDLGPKMYLNSGQLPHIQKQNSNCKSIDIFDSENGPITVIHTDVCDAFNLCVNVHSAHQNNLDSKGVGCIWDIFHADDLQIVEGILGEQIENSQTYLDSQQRQLIRDRGGLHWRVEQREGDAILVPTGCAHQVRNLTSTTKCAWDFASASHIDQILQKQQRNVDRISAGLEAKNDTLQAECVTIQAALIWLKSLDK